MKLRPRYSSRLARALKVRGIVLYPFVFFSDSREHVPESVLRHEMVHVRQVRKLGWVRFYALYVLEYFVNLWSQKSHDQAYRLISFEDEAYRLEKRAALSEDDRMELNLS